MKGISRWFVRCQHCLSVGVIGEHPIVVQPSWVRPQPAAGTTMVCGLCGGPVEDMGRVQGQRLTTDHLVCPCDHRCTGAVGPVCDCPCGGENHGTNRLVTVTRDAGPAPVVRMPASEQAQAIAAEFLAARDLARARRDTLRARKAAGEFLGAADFRRMMDIERLIAKANKGRVHASRMKALALAIA